MAADTDKDAQMQSEQAAAGSSLPAAGDTISIGVGAGASHVAAGKNIIQIGSLSFPRWAAFLIVGALALVAVFGGLVAYFTQQTGASTQRAAAILAYTPTPSPTATPVPTVTPTALPFAPAADGETMIVILPFHTTAANNTEPHKKIWRRIQALLQQKMPNGRVTAVIDPNTVLTADQQAEAEIVGKRYNASMVIWGEDTGVELIASFLNLRAPEVAAADVDIEEVQRTQLANPGQYAEFVTRELPGQLAFLALFAVGQTYYLDGNYPPAIDTIESAVAEVSSAHDQDPGDQAAAIAQGLTEAYFRLGWLYQQEPADLNAALANYDRAIAQDPQFAPAYVNRGVAYSDKGDLDGAIANFTQAIALAPQVTDGFHNRGLAYYAKGDFDQSIADFTEVITLDPQAADAYVDRGNAYYTKGDLDQAIADHNRAIALDPQLPRAYINRGNALYDKGDLDGAVADYTQALTLDPQYAFAYYNRGNAYYAKADLDGAIADYTQAITLNPQDADVYANRGVTYIKIGEYDGAIADFTQAIALAPQLAFAYYNRGNAYYDKGELDQAIADYTQAVALDPQYALAYYNRGNAASGKGDLDGAIADYTQAVTLDPQYADAYDSLCWSFALQQQPTQALPNCDKAVALADDPNYFDSRGVTHALLGDFPAAIADFQVFVDWLAENYPDETQLLDQRRDWVESLRRGENPFTPDVLEELIKQS